MAALKHIQRLLLEDDLLILRKIFRQPGLVIVFYPNEIIRQSSRHKLRARRAFQAVRWKLLELGIIRRMKAAMRNQENFALTRRIRQPANIGQKFLSSGNVKLPAGQHKIGLYIHFPKNKVTRLHSALRRLDAKLGAQLLSTH